jgi:hypothetical protein
MAKNCFVWALTFASHSKGRTKVEGIWDQRVEEKVAGGWRRLHSEELHNLSASPNIIRLINSRRMK